MEADDRGHQSGPRADGSAAGRSRHRHLCAGPVCQQPVGRSVCVSRPAPQLLSPRRVRNIAAGDGSVAKEQKGLEGRLFPSEHRLHARRPANAAELVRAVGPYARGGKRNGWSFRSPLPVRVHRRLSLSVPPAHHGTLVPVHARLSSSPPEKSQHGDGESDSTIVTLGVARARQVRVAPAASSRGPLSLLSD